jgi:ubiquinone/menaquinone biosynthesis C-methylase UbiE
MNPNETKPQDTSDKYTFASKQKPASDRIPEAEGMYSDRKDVEVYAEHSRSGIVGWTERRFVRDLIKDFGHFPNLNVLDIGTGPAWIPIALAKLRPTWKITAVDASEFMLEQAKSTARWEGVSINFIQATAEKIPLPDEKFDLVISHFAFHEFSNPEEVGREISRLLRPDGFAVVQDLQRPPAWQITPLVTMASLANWSRAMGQQYRDSLLASYKPHELREILAVSGLITAVKVLLPAAGGILRAFAVKSSQTRSKAQTQVAETHAAAPN